MIISGSVQSLMGGIPIKELKAGDTVIDMYHCPRKVESVEQVDCSGGLASTFVPGLAITPATKLLTVYGEREAKSGPLTIRTEGGMEVNDELKPTKGSKAYAVKVHDADFIFVSGYAVGVERC